MGVKFPQPAPNRKVDDQKLHDRLTFGDTVAATVTRSGDGTKGSSANQPSSEPAAPPPPPPKKSE